LQLPIGNDFDTLRAVGLRPRQAQRTVFVTALVCTVAGVTIGAPLGFVLGRFGWRITEDALYVDSGLVQPLPMLVVASAVAAVATVAVAAWPAWSVVHRRVRSEPASGRG